MANEATAAAPVETTAAQVTSEINREKKSNRIEAAINGGLGLAGVATYAAMTALFPPAGIPGLFAMLGLVYTSLKGWKLIENIGTEISLNKAKQEAADESSFKKTSDRAAKLAKVSKTALKATLGVFGFGVAVALAGWIAPAVVPAALATTAFTVAVGTMIAGASVTSYLDGEKKGASKIAAFAKSLFAADKPVVASATDNAPAAVSSVPSVSPGFGLAVNGNETPKTTAVGNDAPALKKDAPKPYLNAGN